MTSLTDPQPTPRQTPTMREVAALAHVSIKTVSRVINQEAGVSPELTRRVREAVRMLNYQHNTTASNLRRADQRTATIGLLLDDVANPFLSVLHRAIEDVAWQHNTLLFAGSSDADPEREEQMIVAFSLRRVDGLIIVPASYDQWNLQHMEQLGRPIVFVDRRPRLQAAASVTVDNRAGAVAAVRHLATHGHTRIAFLGDLHSIWTAMERHAGYIEGLATQGIRLDPRLVRLDMISSRHAEQAALELLAADDRPTAFFAGQNMIAFGVIRALQQRGLQHSVALIVFDDFTLADLLEPRVTVVAHDPAALGRAAAELLFARLADDSQPPQHVVLPTRLVPRGSGEIVAPEA